MRAPLWALFPRSAWAQPGSVVASTKGEGATLASVRLCAWAQPANLVSLTADDVAALPSVLSVGVLPVSGGHDR
jgi:hypothetical protein